MVKITCFLQDKQCLKSRLVTTARPPTRDWHRDCFTADKCGSAAQISKQSGRRPYFHGMATGKHHLTRRQQGRGRRHTCSHRSPSIEVHKVLTHRGPYVLCPIQPEHCSKGTCTSKRSPFLSNRVTQNTSFRRKYIVSF